MNCSRSRNTCISTTPIGIAGLEKLSFEAYNECDVLIGAFMGYHQRTGHYSERVLVDRIYRTRNNLAYFKEHGIRVSEPALGRPRQLTKGEKQQAYSDNVDCIKA